ncbi:RGPS2 factor, partial [Atractosteus spatula]|nr:RGPS2 factor [Atractosteus spatula]
MGMMDLPNGQSHVASFTATASEKSSSSESLSDKGSSELKKSFDAVVFDVLKVTPEEYALVYPVFPHRRLDIVLAIADAGLLWLCHVLSPSERGALSPGGTRERAADGQITLMDAPVFKAIQPEELSSCGWNKKEKYSSAPNAVAFTRRFNQRNGTLTGPTAGLPCVCITADEIPVRSCRNRPACAVQELEWELLPVVGYGLFFSGVFPVSFWVVREILHAQTLKIRAEVLSHYIKTGKKLCELNNLHALMAVVSGLQSAPIFRLTKTWALLSRKDKTTFEKLEYLMSKEDNYKRLREYISSLSMTPCIPYLGPKELVCSRLQSAAPGAVSLLLSGMCASRMLSPNPSSCGCDCSLVMALSRRGAGHSAGQQLVLESDRGFLGSCVVLGWEQRVGIYLSDLTYIDSAYPSTGSILENEQRSNLMNNILRIISDLQRSCEYDIPVLPHVQKYLNSVRYIEELQKFVEDDNYKLSLKIEPASSTPRSTASREDLVGPDAAASPQSGRRSAVAEGALAKVPPTPPSPRNLIPYGHRKCHSLGYNFIHKMNTAEFKSATFPNAGSRHLLDDSVMESHTPSRGQAESSTLSSGISLGSSEGSELSEEMSWPAFERTRFYHSMGPVTRVARIPYRGHLKPSSSVESEELAVHLYPGAVTVQGVLRRKTLLKEGKKPTVASWTKYWVALCGTQLFYYPAKSLKATERKHFKSTSTKSTSVVGWMAMMADDPEHPDVFILTDSEHGNSYKYQAGNKMNAVLWFKHLSAACQSNKQQVRTEPESLGSACGTA